jgi:ribosomal protein L37AE/L43A
MEKYGVTEQTEKTAEAVESKKCPVCGSELVDVEQTGVYLCPQCGSKPFEE